MLIKKIELNVLAGFFVAGDKNTAASLALLQEKPYIDAGGPRAASIARTLENLSSPSFSCLKSRLA